MKIPLYQIDAFTGTVFRGNPAAVCPLDDWLDAETMQRIAAENNLPETAFFVPGDPYELRWFTPTVEVDLCGHATLASAFVIFEHLDPARREIAFATRSGVLTVARQGDRLILDFPALPAAPVDPPPDLVGGLCVLPREWRAASNYLAVFDAERDVRELVPDMELLAELDRGVIVTAPGDDADFVSRFFAPAFGVPEDPVTGSAHCTLAPYWAERLGKDELHALQVSARGGELWCAPRGDRVLIAGRAVRYLEGTIYL